jgi:hypothetical protein
VQAAVRSGDFGSSAHLLRTLATAADAPALRRLVPAIVAVLKCEADEGVAAAAAAAGAEPRLLTRAAASQQPPAPAPAAARRPQQQQQQQLLLSAVLHIVDALVANAALPVEGCGDELLALVTSLAIHRAPSGAPQPPPPPPPLAAPAATAAPAAPTSFQQRAALRRGYAAALGALDGECVEAQVRLRQLAARTLGGLIARLERERLRVGDGGGADATGRAQPIRQPLAALLRHVLLSSPPPPSCAGGGGAPAPAAAVVFGQQQQEEEEEEEDAGGDASMGVAAAAAGRALQLPLPSPSVYGATVALGCVGARAFSAGLAPVALRLGAHWADVAEDATALAHVRAWARHCAVALERVSAGFFGAPPARRRQAAAAPGGGGVVSVRLVSAAAIGAAGRRRGGGASARGRRRPREICVVVARAARPPVAAAHRLAARGGGAAVEAVECGAGHGTLGGGAWL